MEGILDTPRYDYNETNVIALLKKIPQQKQRQDSTDEQLKDLQMFANKLGMYDAADFIKSVIRDIE